MGEIAQYCIGLYTQTNRSRARTHGLLTLPPADPDLCVTVSCFNNLPLSLMIPSHYAMYCCIDKCVMTIITHHNHIGKWAHGNPSCKLPEQLVPNNEISAVHACSITGVYVRVVLESFLLYLPGQWDGGGIQQYQS